MEPGIMLTSVQATMHQKNLGHLQRSHQQNLGELWIAMDCCGLLWVAVQHCTEAPIQSTEATELSSSVQRGTLLWDHPGFADESDSMEEA